MTKHRGVIMSPASVLAILDGRKTQTRRTKATYTVGDVLYVKEPWASRWDCRGLADEFYMYTYAATPRVGIRVPGIQRPVDRMTYLDHSTELEHHLFGWPIKWRTAMFMPRQAARLWIRITEVREEPLHEISQYDVLAEGFTMLTKDGGRTYKFGLADSDGWPGNDDFGWHWKHWSTDHRQAFARHWDGINAKRGYPWADNPTVHAYTFEPVERPT